MLSHFIFPVSSGFFYYVQASMRNILGLLILILLFGTGASAQDIELDKIPFSRFYSLVNFGGGTQNWDFSQNESGFLYVANNYGLFAYDGSRWRKHEVPSTTKLRSVYAADSSRIYVGGQAQLGYFSPDSSGELVFTSLLDAIPDKYRNFDDVWRIIPKGDTILFNTNRYLFSYDGHSMNTLEPAFPIGFLLQVHGKYYTSSDEEGFLQLNGKRLEKLNQYPRLMGKTVISAIPFRDDSVLLFVEKGGVYILDAKGKLSKWQTKSAIPGGINTCLTLSDGRFAVGTQNEGLYIYNQNGELEIHLNKGGGLNSRTVLCLQEDQFHNLWVGLNNGINYIILNSPFSLINEKVSLPGKGYTAARYNEQVYLGTSSGLYRAMEKGYEEVPGTEGQAYNLNTLNEQLLVAHHRGLFEVQGGQAVPLFNRTGTWKADQLPVSPYWLCGTYEGFALINEDNPADSRMIEGFNESSRVFEFNNSGDVWMTHGYKGVYRLSFSPEGELQELHQYDSADGFPSNILINVFRVNDELLFAAEQGIYQYNPVSDQFITDTAFTRLVGPGKHVSDMKQDMMGNIYYIADGALGLLRKNSLGEYVREEKVFLPVNQFLVDEFENITPLGLEDVVIGANEGFIHFNPVRTRKPSSEFNCFIRQVSLTGLQDSVLYNGFGNHEVKVSHDQHSFNFTFASPYYESSNALEYRYRLEGYDEAWMEWETADEATYTNLPPGSYTFEAQARTPLGRESQVATYSITISPPWYANTVAYLIYLLVVLFTIGLVLFIQDRKHKQQTASLTLEKENEIKKREHLLEENSERTRVAISQLKNEKLQSEIDHKNRELANTTMHLLDKNEFIIDIKRDLKAVLGNGHDARSEINQIIKSIDRNVNVEADWEHFTLHFDDVHNGFLKRLKEQYPNITPLETKLAAFLRMGMNTKEIASLLHNSVRGVEISRYRLRKKLHLGKDVNLTEFMQGL